MKMIYFAAKVGNRGEIGIIHFGSGVPAPLGREVFCGIMFSDFLVF
jgi:hypothetical protein